MEFHGYNLHRVDVHQVSATGRGTMDLLPPGKKAVQRVVVGDKSGDLTCFQTRKAELEKVFTHTCEHPIASLQLGGPIGQQDKIFVAHGSVVTGVSKKGKVFFTLDTNLSESVQAMQVEAPVVWTAGQTIVSTFVDGKDEGYLMSPDKINDLRVVAVDGGFVPVIACNDGLIRSLETTKVALDLQVEHSVMTLAKTGLSSLLYGTTGGVFGEVFVKASKMRKRWSDSDADYTPVGEEAVMGRKRAAITALASYDVFQSGDENVVVGREDGTFQVFAPPSTENEEPQPQLLYSDYLSESITGFAGGFVTNPNQAEMLVSTYSGRIVSFTPEAQDVMDAEEKQGLLSKLKGEAKAGGGTKQTARIDAVRKEVQDLRAQWTKEKEAYSKVSGAGVAVAPKVHLESRFTLDPDTGTSALVIEAESPIEAVVLRSDVPVELLDVDSNIAIVSRSPPTDGSFLLATYRCQVTTRRIEMRVRSIEGQHGVLQAYIIPKGEPKTCGLRTHSIKPLSLHSRIHALEESDSSRPLNTLKIVGKFGLAEVHAWLAMCMPDIPDRSPAEDLTYYFRSAFLGTVLIADLRKGEATLQSDSVSTISILKEVITREATSRKMPISIDVDMKDASVAHVLKLLHPKLEHQLSLTSKVEMIDALKEIEMMDSDVSYLPQEYQDILGHAEDLKAEHTHQSNRLEFLFGLITDLYIDKFKFKGQDVKARVPALLAVLNAYTPEGLQAFFEASPYS